MNSRFALFFATHYGFVALIAILGWGIGDRLTSRINFRSTTERFVFCSALGLGVLSYLVLAVGLLHLFTRIVITSLLIVIVLWASPTWKKFAGRMIQGGIIKFRAFHVLLFLTLLPILLLPLYPPVQWDATSYHLAAAKIYVRSHAVVLTPYLRFPVFPQTNEMLFSLMLLLFDDISAQLVEFLMMALVAIAIYSWGQRIRNERAGLWAAILWLSNPLVLWLGASAYVDIGLTLFLTLAVYAFFNWMESRDDGWLVISAGFFGFAAGTKYLALFLIGVFGLFVCYLAIREKKFRDVLLFSTVLLAVASPWYLRNAYYTGDPIWPYLSSKLGYSFWSAGDLQTMFQEQASYGTGKTLKSLVELPWNLAFSSATFHASKTPLAVSYLFLLPLCLWEATKKRQSAAIMIVAALYTLFWFSTVQVARYLLPAVPLLSLGAACAIDRFLKVLVHPEKQPWRAGLKVIVTVSLLTCGWKGGSALIPELLPPATPQERVSYLERNVRAYGAIEFLNQLKGKNYTVYALGSPNLAYFADGGLVGDWFGPARYSRILNHFSDPGALVNQIRGLGADFFLLDESAGPGEAHSFDAFENTFLDGHLKLVYARSYLLLFKVLDKPEEIDEGSELLSNDGFEDISRGAPISWTIFGTPVVDNSGRYSHRGLTAVQSDQNSWLIQAVAVNRCGRYLLRNFSRATGPDQFVRLQVNWLDENRHFLGTDIEVFGADPSWQKHSMPIMAPDGAFWAEVYASVHGDSKVWLDDFSFVQLVYHDEQPRDISSECKLIR